MSEGKSHHRLVVDQFGGQAEAYLASEVHAKGDDLAQIAKLIDRVGARTVLDMGCGAGHASFAVAPHAGEVVAFDLSDEMLAVVREAAHARGFSNVRAQAGSALDLPFADEMFDAVVSRYSAHHWGDIAKGVAEAARVLKPGGTAAFADVIAPRSTVCDTFVQTIEMLRDPSHVRDDSRAQWEAHAEAAGFTVTRVIERRLRLEFATWITRIRTPQVFVEAIRALQQTVSSDVRDYFSIEPDGSFTLDTMVMELVKG